MPYFPDSVPKKIIGKEVLLIINEKHWKYQNFSMLCSGTSLIFTAHFLLKFLVISVVVSYQMFY